MRATPDATRPPAGAPLGRPPEADEPPADRRKDAVPKEPEKARDKTTRWSFAEYARTDEPEKAGAGDREAAKEQVVFEIRAGGLTLHRVLAVPKNQVLLVVRVVQVPQAAAEAPAAAEAEARPAADSVREAPKEAAH